MAGGRFSFPDQLSSIVRDPAHVGVEVAIDTDSDIAREEVVEAYAASTTIDSVGKEMVVEQ